METTIKAYAFWETSGEESFRTGTLLVSEGDETVVGNCIMKNPGSSLPLRTISSRTDGRLEFSIDATMRAVAELFLIDRYGGSVRIFNLSDIRSANFQEIRTSLKASCCDIAEELSKAPETPTYIGWGDMWKDDRFRWQAQNIFDTVKKHSNVLSENLEDNPFFHPLYLIRYARNNPECLRIVKAFRGELPTRTNATLFNE